jgi:HK97 family phage prohead protease
MKKEIRMISTPVKIVRGEDGEVRSIIGYPIVYNKDSEDMGFIERIAPGAAKEALKRSDVRGLKNHDPNLIFARQGVNLTLIEDKDGLRYEATPIETRNYREVSAEIGAGLLTGQSFGFTIDSDEWSDLDTDHPKRTITKIREIFDVGPVTYPAYQDTTVALRSLEEARENNSPEPETDQDPIVVSVSWTTKQNGTTEGFTGDDAVERAIEYLESLRSSSQPTLPDADSTPAGPTPQEPEGDKILVKMNSIIEKYS